MTSCVQCIASFAKLCVGNLVTRHVAADACCASSRGSCVSELMPDNRRKTLYISKVTYYLHVTCSEQPIETDKRAAGGQTNLFWDISMAALAWGESIELKGQSQHS